MPMLTLLYPGFRAVATQALDRAYPYDMYSVYNSAAPKVSLRHRSHERFIAQAH